MDANIASVAKYGGFYVGRYEAGWDAVKEDTTTYKASKPIGDSKVPLSKYGYSVCNHISQVNSSVVCDRLNNVKGYENVTARLIDGYAWDTAVEYISDSVNSIIDSKTYGNYNNGTSKSRGILTGYNIYKKAKSTGTGTSEWAYNNIIYRYEPNEVTIGARELDENTPADMELATRILKEEGTIGSNDTIDSTNYTYTLYYELTTGGAESTKVKNIYDLAGNMWEWTSEVGGHGSLAENNWTNNNQTFAVVRGGCFNSSENGVPISYRNGNVDVTNSVIAIGFRVVLYVN